MSNCKLNSFFDRSGVEGEDDDNKLPELSSRFSIDGVVEGEYELMIFLNLLGVLTRVSSTLIDSIEKFNCGRQKKIKLRCFAWGMQKERALTLWSS